MNLNPVTLLNRFLKRGGGGQLAAQIYAHAIGQPLLVHPQMGEQIIGAYMRGGIEARPPTMTIGELAPQATSATGVVTPARNVAVLNVSGGLVNRYEGDFCDPGPLSYESLRGAFDASQSDPTVEAIVVRIESPGGMGSGLFDLADYIHASRGTKPIYAAIDDYAYSAAYALAAACDQVWITRTGGAGSVGVIAYHVDQSGFDAKLGVKVTAIYSGAHKNDMSPHAALDSGTHAWLQARMDSMRTLFAESVAKYRNMKVEAVMATEAQVYQGADAVAIGFADRLGTYAELMAEISAGKPTSAAPPASNTQGSASGPPSEDEEADKAAAPAVPAAELAVDVAGLQADAVKALAEAVTAAKLPEPIAAALIKRGPLKGEAATAAVAHAQLVRDTCAAVDLELLAPEFIGANTSVIDIRAKLTALRVADDPEISTHHKSKSAASARPAADVYTRRRAAVQGMQK